MISIVVPCYNEEQNICRLVKRFIPIAENFSTEGFQLVLVNNGSTDNTQRVIESEAEKHNFISNVNIQKNIGYGYGICEGLKACEGEWMGWIHADLQLPPEALQEFWKIIIVDRENAKETYFKGRRSGRPLSDRFFTACMGIYESIYLGQKLWDINAQPTLIHRDFYSRIENPPNDFSFDLYVYYLARKASMRVVRVPVVQQDREAGVSSWNDGGLKARINLIKRTLIFSKNLKKDIKNIREGNLT